MRHARRKRSSTRSSHDPATARLIRTLVEGCGSPAEALELYYWSREPGLVQVVNHAGAEAELGEQPGQHDRVPMRRLRLSDGAKPQAAFSAEEKRRPGQPRRVTPPG